MSEQQQPRQPTQEELRAAYEEQLKQIKVDDVLVQTILSLINLGLLCGHVGRYGSGLNPLRGQNNVQGGGDMGAIPNKLPGFQDIE